MNNNPTISVVMAVYNEDPNMLGESINSILNQSYGDLELILVDDSTKSETKKVLRGYQGDKRVKLIELEGHSTLPRKLNIGLEEASGELIARMDADDIAVYNRFEEQKKYLDSHKDISVLGGQTLLIDDDGIVYSEKKFPVKGISFFIKSLYKNPLNHPSVIFRRSIIDSGLKYDESLERSEDLDLWLRMMYAGYKIENLDIPVTKYRVDSREMIEKRSSRKEVEYMYYVRRKNATLKHPIHSVLSIFAGFLFVHLPQKVIIRLYSGMYRG